MIDYEDGTPEELELAREADRVYAFCLHGLGHDMIVVEPAEPEVGLMAPTIYCNRCDTDLSNDELYNPKEA